MLLSGWRPDRIPFCVAENCAGCRNCMVVPWDFHFNINLTKCTIYHNGTMVQGRIDKYDDC